MVVFLGLVSEECFALEQFSLALQDAKGALLRYNGEEAVKQAERGVGLAKDIKDERAERSAVKVKGQGYRWVHRCAQGGLASSSSCCLLGVDVMCGMKRSVCTVAG